MRPQNRTTGVRSMPCWRPSKPPTAMPVPRSRWGNHHHREPRAAAPSAAR